MSAQVAEPEVESALHNELEPGERLLWSARPARGLLLRWANAVLSSDLPASAQFVMATPLVLLAMFILIGRFFFDAKLREQTYYGLTDRRILLVSEGFVRKVKGFDLHDLGPIGIEPSAGGSGTVSFEWPAMPAGRWHARRRGPQLQLEMIADVESAYQQMHSAQQARRALA